MYMHLVLKLGLLLYSCTLFKKPYNQSNVVGTLYLNVMGDFTLRDKFATFKYFYFMVPTPLSSDSSKHIRNLGNLINL